MTLEETPILVVDDEAFMRELVRRMLSEMGYPNIHVSSNGRDALRQLRDSAPPIGLVMLDLNMPEMSGFEVLTFIRNAPEIASHDVPVIVTTGRNDEEAVRTAVEIGVNGYLVKPFSKAEVTKRVKQALSNPMIDKNRLK